jgi:hypothetical protein
MAAGVEKKHEHVDNMQPKTWNRKMEEEVKAQLRIKSVQSRIKMKLVDCDETVKSHG